MKAPMASETPQNARMEATILDVRDLPATAPDRLGKTDRLVLYQVGGAQRYAVRVPAETFSDDALRAAIKADIAHRGQLIGRKLTL